MKRLMLASLLLLLLLAGLSAGPVFAEEASMVIYGIVVWQFRSQAEPVLIEAQHARHHALLILWPICPKVVTLTSKVA
jgi:hypothetical protein